MLLISFFSALIVVFYLVLRCRWSRRPTQFLAQFFGLALASALAENSAIRLYGFYTYDPGWRVFVDQVPLLVAIIWPVVILSARDLVRQAQCHRLLLGALIVLADAALIEPVAVHAGLWVWHQPGLFAVPPVALFGWGAFAFLAVRALPPHGESPTSQPACRRGLSLLLPPLLIHPLLLASWWGAFRWVNTTLPPLAGTIAVWIIALGTSVIIWRKRPSVPRRLVLIRLPAALFFFILLALTHPPPILVAYAIAFALPYCTILKKGDGLSN